MNFSWVLLLCAGICYCLYNILISIHLKTILTSLGYKIRFKFIFLSHMAGVYISYFTITNNHKYCNAVITTLERKNIPPDITTNATNALLTYYTSHSSVFLFRLIEWTFIALFSVIIFKVTFITILCCIFLIIYIETLINITGVRGFSSLDITQENLSEHYNAIDGDSDEKAYNSDICVQRYFQRRKTKTIKNLLKASNEDIILDIGCGSGVQMQALDLTTPKLLIGTDLSLNALKYAKNKNIPNCEFVQCDAQQLPFKTQSIDKIICAELIEHLPEPTCMINEAQRVLKNNGSIVITTPNEISIWGFYEFLWDMFGRGRNYGETHLRFFSVSDLDAYFKSFTTRYATTLFFLSPLVALLNNRTFVQWSKHFDAPFEQTNNGVSIVYYAKK